MTDFERNEGHHDTGAGHLPGFEGTDTAGVPGAHSEALQTRKELDKRISAVVAQLDGLDLDIADGEEFMGGINEAASYRFGSDDSLSASL
jgi:hypothetical protein